MDKVFIYNRLKGVPENHYMIIKILCFGEMGGPHYKDEIIAHSENRELLKEYCKENKYDIFTGAWKEYFIQAPKP